MKARGGGGGGAWVNMMWRGVSQGIAVCARSGAVQRRAVALAGLRHCLRLRAAAPPSLPLLPRTHAACCPALAGASPLWRRPLRPWQRSSALVKGTLCGAPADLMDGAPPAYAMQLQPTMSTRRYGQRSTAAGELQVFPVAASLLAAIPLDPCHKQTYSGLPVSRHTPLPRLRPDRPRSQQQCCQGLQQAPTPTGVSDAR